MICREWVETKRPAGGHPCGNRAKYLLNVPGGQRALCGRHANKSQYRNQPTWMTTIEKVVS